VGERCLFSSGIHARTGDSHSVVDLAGRRINPSRDIVIGDHVWVGMGATLLKGALVAESSVIAAQAVVTKQFPAPNVVIAGNPARVVREGVDWLVERIPLPRESS
jgi:acetyltransferase-like isoleucine patch superfamily enzyme